MSVINQMLKDLEQRQSSEVNSSPAATYTVPKQHRSLRLLLSLLAVITVLLMIIIWQLFNANESADKQAKEVDSKSNNNVTTNVSSQQVNDGAAQQIAPKSTQINSVVKTSESGDAKQMTVDNNDSLPQQMTLPEQQRPIEKNETLQLNSTMPVSASVSAETSEKTGSRSNDTSLPENNSASSLPKESKQAGQLKIEKTSSYLSPEQRLAQLFDKAQAAFDKGYISEAVEKLNKVLSMDDGHLQARNLLAVAWYGRGESQQAVKIINDGLQRYPNTELWRLTAAKIFFKENKLAGAFSYLDADLTNASKEYYSMQANLARQLNNFGKAEFAYKNLIKLEPDIGNWWLGLAISQDSLGKSVEAQTSYETTLSKAGVSSQSIVFVEKRLAELRVMHGSS